jgi:hypothetical protein
MKKCRSGSDSQVATSWVRELWINTLLTFSRCSGPGPERSRLRQARPGAAMAGGGACDRIGYAAAGPNK